MEEEREDLLVGVALGSKILIQILAPASSGSSLPTGALHLMVLFAKRFLRASSGFPMNLFVIPSPCSEGDYISRPGWSRLADAGSSAWESPCPWVFVG